MTQEDKELLLKDLCARLPYDVYVRIRYKEGESCYGKLTPRDIQWFFNSNIEFIKPYLRPMSSMTEEEIKEFTELIFISDPNSYGYLKECELFSVYCNKAIDWLNKKMFDYRGLIPMGLAIEVTEENNPYKE